VGVVDGHEETSIAGLIRERRPSSHQDVAARRAQIREQVAEGAKWDRSRSLRPDRAHREVTPVRRERDELVGKAALADTAFADEDDPTGRAVERGRGATDQVVSADERRGHAHSAPSLDENE
jgi:hypothetical protein